MPSEVKWIKIVTDIFDDEKILLIESMPEADGIIVIWFKILCLAGKINNCGVLAMNNRIAYTDEMLSQVFRRPLNTVRLALKTFEKFGMIEIINETIVIPNWEKHQNIEGMERVREQTRKRVGEYRERQRLGATLAKKNEDVTLQVTLGNAAEEDKERDREKDIKNNEQKSTDYEQLQKRFDVFWNAYGNKKGKKNALKAFQRINPDEELFQKIMQGIEKYHESRKWRENYRKEPATWLNGECWMDEYDDESVVKSNQEHRGNHTGDSFKPRTVYALKPQFVGHKYDADGNDITEQQPD